MTIEAKPEVIDYITELKEENYILKIRLDFALNTLKAIRGKNIPFSEEEIIADDAIKTIENIIK